MVDALVERKGYKMTDENMSVQMQALREDMQGMRADQTKLFVMVERISTQLEHGDTRFDRISEKIDNHHDRIDSLERNQERHAGELAVAKWIWSVIVGFGVVGAAVIAYFK